MTKSALSPKPDALPGRGSLWRHKKGTLYRVVLVSRHTEDPDVWLVSYEPAEGGETWTRVFTSFRQPEWPAFADEGRFAYVSGPRTWREEQSAEPTRQELLELLDNVSASARNMLSQFAGQMKDEDLRWRREIINEARALSDRLLRPEPIRA
jgi:hypothetical protein